MEVKPRYKQTEVGIIPEEWEVKRLKQFATVKGGKRLPMGRSLSEKQTKHPYIRVADMYPGGVKLGEIKYVPEDVFPAIKNYRIHTGDLFISVAGTLGIVGRIPVDLDGANLTENANRITDIACDQDFLLYSLSSYRIQASIDSVRTVGAQPKLALGRIEDFRFPLPPTEGEQRAVAAALSDTDALLHGLDRLIAKKRDLKRAAMQQLLTGETRLPGFRGQWEVRLLGSVGTFLKGSGVRKDESQSGELPCVRYGEIYTDHHDYIRSFSSRISHKVAATAMPLKYGDLLFAGSGETREEIGKCVAFADRFPAYAGGDIVILRPHDPNPIFFGYYCNTPRLNAQKARLGQGDAVVHIGAKSLAAIEIKVPEKEEQTAIATVLSDMDAEIEALERRRDKTRALKQAMMQELLTGRTRLV